MSLPVSPDLIPFRPQSVANARLLDAVLERSDAFRRDPLAIFPWLLPPCPVRVLLVTDGGLDFSDQDFGLSTSVSVLRDEKLTYVELDLTLAHLRSDVTDGQVMAGAPGITRSIKDFRFDEPRHFRPRTSTRCGCSGSTPPITPAPTRTATRTKPPTPPTACPMPSSQSSAAS